MDHVEKSKKRVRQKRKSTTEYLSEIYFTWLPQVIRVYELGTTVYKSDFKR